MNHRRLRMFRPIRRIFAGAQPDQADVPAAMIKAGPWAATHRHKKGGLYRVLTYGILETDRSEVVIYDDPEGTIWVRPRVEFEDGRFTALTHR